MKIISKAFFSALTTSILLSGSSALANGSATNCTAEILENAFAEKYVETVQSREPSKNSVIYEAWRKELSQAMADAAQKQRELLNCQSGRKNF